MRKLLFMVLFFCGVVSMAIAQQKTVTGTVTGADDGLTIIGATVQIKGTTTGVTSDLDGNYSISANEGNILVFRFVGMKMHEEVVGAGNVIDVVLELSNIGLDEVVVIGYGSAIKRELTGAITKVSTEGLSESPNVSLESAIQGKTAGVFIEQASGKLGETVKMRIRGSSSISANNQPLYVVDGIPITSTSVSNTSNQPTSPLSDINMNDIESIQILKDASAAAIYGSRASNGVVLITTKRGEKGTTKFNVSYTTGISEPSRLMEWLNSDQYLELFDEALAYTAALDGGFVWGWLEPDDLKDYYLGEQWRDGHDTDWQSEAFQRGSINKINVSASGGTEKGSYYAGFSYDNTASIMLGNFMNKLGGRVSIDQQASERLRFGFGINIMRTEMDRVENDNAFATPLQLVAQAPVTPVIDPATGEYNKNTIYYNGLISYRDASNNQVNFRTLSNAYVVYDLVKGLSFRSDFGADILDIREKSFWGRETIGAGPGGEAMNRSVRVVNYNWENYLTYSTVINNHDINIVAGMSFQESQTTGSNIEGKGFPTDSFTNIASAAEATTFSSWEDGTSYLSYFGRLNYKLAGKYLFSASGRVDGSSRFGTDNRYGFFPAASAGWLISEEDFMDNIENTVSYLKVRASYGVTGNSGIPDYAHLALYEGVNYAGRNGLKPTQLASNELGWETTSQFDIGLDFGFFNNRVTGEIDYYNKQTTDLLLYLPLPSTSGFTGVWKNVGELENKGVEFAFHSNNTKGAFKWTTDFNIAFNKNKVINVNGPEITPNELNYVIEGQPIGVFKMVKYAGVDPANGDALYYLEAGSDVTTNNYNSAATQIVGSPNPDFSGGFSNTFDFKGFDLTALISFVYGNKVYNGGGGYQSVQGDWWDNQTVDQMDRWQQAGDITDIPQARFAEGNGTRDSDRFLSDASYMRLRNLTLGYTLPDNISSRLKLASARIYVGVQNLYTLTNYKGWDPEVNYTGTNRSTQSSNIIQGYDFYTAPQARTYSVGINLSF
jgi:TonB-linked SusC/RagA family outer membrane protein